MEELKLGEIYEVIIRKARIKQKKNNSKKIQ